MSLLVEPDIPLAPIQLELTSGESRVLALDLAVEAMVNSELCVTGEALEIDEFFNDVLQGDRACETIVPGTDFELTVTMATGSCSLMAVVPASVGSTLLAR